MPTLVVIISLWLFINSRIDDKRHVPCNVLSAYVTSMLGSMIIVCFKYYFNSLKSHALSTSDISRVHPLSNLHLLSCNLSLSRPNKHARGTRRDGCIIVIVVNKEKKGEK